MRQERFGPSPLKDASCGIPLARRRCVPGEWETRRDVPRWFPLLPRPGRLALGREAVSQGDPRRAARAAVPSRRGFGAPFAPHLFKLLARCESASNFDPPPHYAPSDYGTCRILDSWWDRSASNRDPPISNKELVGSKVAEVSARVKVGPRFTATVVAPRAWNPRDRRSTALRGIPPPTRHADPSAIASCSPLHGPLRREPLAVPPVYRGRVPKGQKGQPWPNMSQRHRRTGDHSNSAVPSLPNARAVHRAFSARRSFVQIPVPDDMGTHPEEPLSPPTPYYPVLRSDLPARD